MAEREIVGWLGGDNSGTQAESTPILADLGDRHRAVSGGEAAEKPHHESKELRRESDGMIAVDCENCGETLRVPRDAIGSQVRCPLCGSTVSTVPPSRMPVILAFCALGTIFLAFVGVFVYERYLRDTWARDNYSMLIERLDEAKSLVVSRKDEQALGKYDELLRLIGDHAINDADLKSRLAEAREQRKRIVAEQEARQRKLAEEQARRDDATKQAPNLIKPLPAYGPAPYWADRKGQIDWAIAEKVRTSWRNGNFRSADRAEQGAAILVIQAGVRKSVHDPLDCEATLDYIQNNIDSW